MPENRGECEKRQRKKPISYQKIGLSITEHRYSV
jgi:hypothetical protein